MFLIDGLGAIVTAILLSQVLARFETVFGMPRDILWVLAGAAGCFAVYSISCHLFLKKNGKPFLQGIAIANLIYCLTTLVLVIYLRESLTYLGLAYFIGEMIIILILVRWEFSAATASS